MAQSIDLGKVVPEKGVDYFTEADILEVQQGMQTAITSDNKIASDLVDDSNSTHKFVTSTDITTWNGKGSYSKPAGGIPKTDLDSTVQSSLDKAESAIQSIGGNVIVPITDTTIRIWGMDNGVYSLPATCDIYYNGENGTSKISINEAGTILIVFGSSTQKGWSLFREYAQNYGLTASSSGSYGGISYLDIQNKGNLVTSISSSSTDTNYPSAKCVYDNLVLKQDALTAGSNISITTSNNTTTISATDTTYSAFTGTDGSVAGTSGLVPAPAASDDGKYLCADGTWSTVQAGTTITYGTSDLTPRSITIGIRHAVFRVRIGGGIDG